MITSSNRDAANAIATSESHPIQVGEIAIGGGILGMTFCPGKHDTGRHGMVWQRNLPMDLDALHQWGARTLVTLMEPHELNTVRVPDLAQQVRARGITWHRLPIVDQSVQMRHFWTLGLI
jgi:hypothetical protein